MTYVAFVSGAVVDPCIVVLLDHMDALPLVNQAPYPIDALTTNYAIDTTIKAFGTGSLKSTGTVGQQVVPYTGEPGGGIELVDGDLTIEFQFRRSGGSGTLGVDLWQYYVFLELDSGGWVQFTIFSSSGFSGDHQGFRLELQDGTNYDELIAQEYPLSDSDFHACAATISSNVARIFLDGVQIGSATLAYSAAGQRLTNIYYADVVGGERTQETRVMLNRAQYTAGYTPATGPWVDDSCDSGVVTAVGLTMFFEINESPSSTVTGDPVTERAAFMAMLSGVANEPFDGFSVGTSADLTITRNGTTCTVDQLLAAYDEDFIDVYETSTDVVISSNTVAGRFNTSSTSDRWLDARVGTGYDAGAPSGLWDGRYRLQFEFSTAIAAFGFYGTDFGDFATANKVVVDLTDSDSVVTTHTITDTSAHSNGNLIFWGFVDDTKTYTKVLIYVDQADGESPDEGLGIDDLVFCTPAYLA